MMLVGTSRKVNLAQSRGSVGISKFVSYANGIAITRIYEYRSPYCINYEICSYSRKRNGVSFYKTLFNGRS